MDGRRTFLLLLAGGILGLLVVPFTVLYPVYSSGETLSSNFGGGFLLAMGLLEILALAPVVSTVGGRFSQLLTVLSGTALILSAFVTVLGMFFVPAGLLLVLAGVTDPRR